MVSALPRDDGGHYQLIRPESLEWSVKNSLFRTYVPDTDEIVQQCFLEDFNNTRIKRFVKNEEDRNRL